MATLDTVQKFVDQARVLLQDQTVPYRYSDASLLQAINLGILEIRRVRPDVFLADFTAIPSYTAVDSTAIALDIQYRPALLYFLVGYTEVTNVEEGQDARGSALMDRFMGQLVSVGGRSG